MYVCMYGHTYSKSMDQPGEVASPARGQLSRKNEYFPVCVVPENYPMLLNYACGMRTHASRHQQLVVALVI